MTKTERAQMLSKAIAAVELLTKEGIATELAGIASNGFCVRFSTAQKTGGLLAKLWMKWEDAHIVQVQDGLLWVMFSPSEFKP